MKKKSQIAGDADKAIEELVNEIWEDRGLAPNVLMNKTQTQAFLEDYVKQLDDTIEISNEAFNMIFKVLDENDD